MTTTTQEKIHWLRLARSENVGKSTFFRLMKIFHSAQNAVESLPDFAGQGGLGRKINLCSESIAEKELLLSQKFGAEILLFCDQTYPRLLREIPDPPPIITVKGKKEFFERDTVAVVGPRNPSFNASSFARIISSTLGNNSIVTVSGMARGVDSAAHQASLTSGTIAVIAGGIDHIYPKENSRLYAEIATQGLLVSESPFGSSPQVGNFVQRNRIISGLSLAVVVVEAGLKSGSLITARFAAEQGREVFSVPGSPLDPRCFGTNRLIKTGANMLESAEDVLSEISGLRSRFQDVGILKEPDVEEFSGPLPKMPADDDIKKIREEIFSKLSFTPITIEGIIQELDAPARLVNIALTQLELADKIAVSFGRVVLKDQ